MATDDWKGIINQILYGLMFTPQLDDDTADQMAVAMGERRYFGAGPDAYADAIVQAGRYDGPLTDEIDTPHGEAAFRDFLGRLGSRLEALRAS
ncbi:hypothetical protein [Micromonospora sp. NPDC005174]|uniref:hypothetical protein n=1 Tax=unclassified Micromonospora TaxID=2617518 RepID=UPI0033A0ADBD